MNENPPDNEEPVPAQRLLQNSLVRLLRERPFYAHLLLGCRRRFVSSTHALGLTVVNGSPTLQVDGERFSAYPADQRQALLEHVILHLLHLHPLRRGGHHRMTWDLACDLAINPSIAGLPATAALPEQYRLEPGLAAEEYAAILSQRFDTGNLSGEGIGDAERDAGGVTGHKAVENRSAPMATSDDHTIWSESDSTPLKLAEQAVRDLVTDAQRQAQGQIPDGVRDLVAGWLAPPAISWRDVLHQFVATAGRIGHRATWMREHRRFSHVTPGQRKRHRLHLLVAIDVSESTDRQELREAFAAELMQIARSRESRITVLYANSFIRRIDSLSGHQVQLEVYRGGGFTDLRPPFAHARTLTPPPAAIIYLTDGFGEAPAQMDFPTLWVLTKEGRKPVDWGIELRLEV